MMEQIDFLQQVSGERLRKEINNITDSYSHPWDALAELLQNAVDAIHRHQRLYGAECRRHSIDIRVNAHDRSITVTDTGPGWDPDKVAYLLAPHGTDKDPDDTGTLG